MWVAFAMQKLLLLTFFQQKLSMYLLYFKIEILNFNIKLANNFVKFWTSGLRLILHVD